MLPFRDETDAGETTPRRLFVYNGGFLTQPRVRRILKLSGYQLRLGRPTPQDLIGVWGQSPYAHRGEAMAKRTGAPIVRIEDAFLRSLHPGRSGEPPMGLVIDHTGVHFDGRVPSDLETLLKTDPFDDTALLDRARGAIARMQETHLSKYSATRLDAPLPAPGYVLIIDQTRNDASVIASGADRNRFLEMLFVAQEEHPGARFVIKTHPETAQGHRSGHYTTAEQTDRITLYDGPASPWALLEGAVAVYTVSSQMGFEAILAGHRPRVFGQPFYAGWNLTDDENPVYRRQRSLTRAQLFAGSMILYPRWYDPYSDQLCELENVVNALDAQTRAWREDHRGWIATGMRLWKRKPLQQFFGQTRKVIYEDRPAKVEKLLQNSERRHMVWAGKATGSKVRVEDGFLRSRGLGAELIPPLSLVVDPIGIYYDPTHASRLEQLIRQRSTDLRPDQIRRINQVKAQISASNLTKYNLSGVIPKLPAGRTILVPGQVEDDASILKGSPDIQSNLELLKRTRAANPDAILLWKPHPDVVAGLRSGHVDAPLDFADLTVDQADMAQLLTQVDEVWTMTSLTGFEALLRGCSVTVLGAPFYAGWGLTRDLGPVPARRLQGPRPTLEALAHATLIDYPRYFDPLTGLACPIEVVIERLRSGRLPRPGPFNRSLAKLQGLFASQAHLWRR
ncbi:capsular polysaccharide biosynthesis protein [Tropicibacter naphthalenivorans]|uniref:Capsule polysaccharide biosynthesis protein n=1 Tax=Tropicibacter naphthalenivorans TaxID=441103 RepID=A0A0N7LZJ5_9RHOB|nr:capsular polysaccharide biosynthesis protein [Tropicibacter naphthalenivorans]CUH77841.1 Capsule polysaccharide biosynthesis protein [Tropicibacter naphthalenivorans]SMC95761.1 capsular polysaccharide export protein [Tropicibacter naphthalenivorans]